MFGPKEVTTLTAETAQQKAEAVLGNVKPGEGMTQIMNRTLGTHLSPASNPKDVVSALAKLGGGDAKQGVEIITQQGGIFRDPALKEWILFTGYTPEVQSNNRINITTQVPGTINFSLPDKPVIPYLNLTGAGGVDSTSNTTGSLIVTNGIGVTGNIYSTAATTLNVSVTASGTATDTLEIYNSGVFKDFIGSAEAKKDMLSKMDFSYLKQIREYIYDGASELSDSEQEKLLKFFQKLFSSFIFITFEEREHLCICRHI